jgi:hypothetical protein
MRTAGFLPQARIGALDIRPGPCHGEELVPTEDKAPAQLRQPPRPPCKWT